MTVNDDEIRDLIFAAPDPKKVRLLLDNDMIAVAFPYDPEWVSKIKQISIRKWEPKYPTDKTGLRRPGAWLVPYSEERYAELVAAFGAKLEISEELIARSRKDKERIAEATALKDAGDAVVPGYAYTTKPYAHQRMGHALLDRNDKFGLLWEQGTGKTKASIDDILRRKQQGRLRGPVLVICPNEVKDQWLRQVPLHSGGALSVELLSSPWAKGKERLARSRADVLVLNCEAIPFIREELLAREWDVVIVDEVTRFKNPQTQRTKTLLKMKVRVPRILTGTPITNSPLDAYVPFQFLSPSIFGSWWAFRTRYCVFGGYGGYEIIAFQHLDELKSKVAGYSSRVLKKDVLDLPPKTYYDNVVELDGETLKHYIAMRDELKTAWLAGGDQVESKARIAITQLLRLTQIAGGLLQQGEAAAWIKDNPKIRALRQIIEDLPPTEKVVVYGVYQHELEAIASEFASLNPGIIYGETSKKERSRIKEEFQDPSSDRRMIVAQIHSGGIGIDLYAAQTVVFYTRNWSLEDYLQAQDRLHRIGQTGTVNVIHIMAKLPGKEDVSIDDVIAATLERKQRFADQVTGDKRETTRDAVRDIELVLGLTS